MMLVVAAAVVIMVGAEVAEVAVVAVVWLSCLLALCSFSCPHPRRHRHCILLLPSQKRTAVQRLSYLVGQSDVFKILIDRASEGDRPKKRVSVEKGSKAAGGGASGGGATAAPPGSPRRARKVASAEAEEAEAGVSVWPCLCLYDCGPLCLCFSASLLLCFSASLLLCFSASLLLCFSVFLYLSMSLCRCVPVSLYLRVSVSLYLCALCL
jgi:hypothetical protein